MKISRWVMVSLAAGALILSCTEKGNSDDDDSVGGSGGTTTTTTTSSGSGGTTTTTPDLGICGTDLSYDDAPIDACATSNCCAVFDPCNADADCLACLTGNGTDCDTNASYQAYRTCLDGSCPLDMCGTGIGFSDQDTGEPLFVCNACGAANCCTDLEGCVGDGSQPALDLCLACLNGDASCTDTSIQEHADGFMSCISTSCAAECE